MKSSQLIPLKEGIFELEKGREKWDIDGCEVVVIAFAGIETALDPKKLESDQEVLCVI